MIESPRPTIYSVDENTEIFGKIDPADPTTGAAEKTFIIKNATGDQVFHVLYTGSCDFDPTQGTYMAANWKAKLNRSEFFAKAEKLVTELEASGIKGDESVEWNLENISEKSKAVLAPEGILIESSNLDTPYGTFTYNPDRSVQFETLGNVHAPHLLTKFVIDTSAKTIDPKILERQINKNPFVKRNLGQPANPLTR